METSRERDGWGEQARCIIALSTPVVLTQLGQMLLGFVDLLMVGHLPGAQGIHALGAVALGRLWVMGTVIVGMGVIFGIDPIVSQGHGAGDARRTSIALQRGLIVALLISIPIGLLWLLTGPVLVGLGQDARLAALAHDYVLVQIPSLPLFLAFNAVRQWLQGRGIVWPGLWVILISNAFNVWANWALIFGHHGLPALGVVGAGVATSLTQAIMLLSLVAWIAVFKLHRGGWKGWTREALAWEGLKEIWRYGTPVAVQLLLEMWAFQLATVLAGWLGEASLAAHTIVLNLASITFMIPLGISIGTVTRVGNLIGERRPQAAQRAAWIAFGLGAGVMGASALFFVFSREWLPTWYTRDASVIALSASLLPVAAAFQLFDGIQVVGGGILRGMGRTRPAAFFNLFGYYVLAMPIAGWLAFGRGMGVVGIWWGLAAGLFIVAILFLIWVALRGPARVDARV